ncbi:MAG: SH3 domain-containing protein [Butyribacter sp.]|nr:SH3 domain-containing protein [bacterium]MDY3853825.1 SH3 domain-containing protein [Butyribacter sp.]
MKNYKSIVLCVIATFVLTVCASLAITPENKAMASAVGTVKVSGLLNVRSGPGTGYSVVKSGGTKVTLSNGEKVTVTGVNGDWYHIKVKQNSKTVTGFAKKTYIKVQTGKVHTKMYGRVTANSVKVRTTASVKAAPVTVNKKTVSVKKAKKVRILSEKLVKNTKWYRIAVTYSSKTCKGYILSKHVELICNKGLPAVLDSSEKVTLLKHAGRKTAVSVNGKKVQLKDGKQMTVLKSKNVLGKKYLYVKVTSSKTAVKGYILDKYGRLQIVKNEKSSTSETTSQTTTSDDTSGMTDAEFSKKLTEDGFPSSYITKLTALHKQYPNWKFIPYKTGLDWNTVIQKESVVGLNLLSVNKSYDWKSFADGAYNWKTDKFIPYDGSTWVTASEKAVKYYMDPRNFLDARGIFQFESLEYQKESHTKAGVEKILNNTPMYNKSYTYTDDSGAKKSRRYSSTFITAASKSGVSPYHLASRVKQEVVISSTLMSSSVSGKVSGYEGIYNFYNIGANNSTVSGGAVANGLNWAKGGSSKSTTYLRPWTSPYKSIVGGASYIGKNYINVGQNTLYLQKFNVTPKNRYSHQYMANIEAPNSEATKTNTAYGTQKETMTMVFSIPVYENMPATPCPVPSGGKNPNNYLKTLSISNHAFSSKFVLGDDGSKIYKVTLPNSVTSIKINATAVSSTATVTGKGTKSVEVGTKTYTVKVKAQSGSVRSYKIQVTRKAA